MRVCYTLDLFDSKGLCTLRAVPFIFNSNTYLCRSITLLTLVEYH